MAKFNNVEDNGTTTREIYTEKLHNFNNNISDRHFYNNRKKNCL